MGRFTKPGRGTVLTTSALLTAWICMGGSAYAADLTWDDGAAGDHNWSSAANWTGDTNVADNDNVTFSTGGATTSNVDENRSIGTLTFNNDGTAAVTLNINSGKTLTVKNITNDSTAAQTITGTGTSVLKAGSDGLSITGNVSYTAADGTLNLSSKELSVTDGGSFTANVQTLTGVQDLKIGDNATLSLIVEDDNAVNGQKLTIGNSGTLSIDDFDLKLASSSPIDIDANANFVVNNEAKLTITSKIQGTGNLNLSSTAGTKGKVVLSNTGNNFTGDVNVENATLVIGGDNVIGDKATNTLNIKDNGGLESYGNNKLDNNVSINNGGGGATTMTYDGDGDLTLNGTVTFDGDGVTLTNNSREDDSDGNAQNGTLIINGTTAGGDLTINGNGTTRFTHDMVKGHGNTNVTSGILINDKNETLDATISVTGDAILINTQNSIGSAKLNLNKNKGLGTSLNPALNNNISNEIDVTSKGTFVGAGALTLSGDVKLIDASKVVLNTISENSFVIMNGQVTTSDPTLTIEKAGVGELRLNATNTIAANLDITKGEVQIGGEGLNGNVKVADGTNLIIATNKAVGAGKELDLANGASLEVNSGNYTVTSDKLALDKAAGTIKLVGDTHGGGEYSLTLTGSADSNATTTGINKTFDVANKTTLVLTGTFQDSSYTDKYADRENFVFNKSGAGTLELNNASDLFHGQLNVNAGSAYINGAGIDGNVIAASGTTFGGVGTIMDNLTLNSATHDPGSAKETVGTVTIEKDYNLSGSSKLNVDIDVENKTNDLVIVKGDANISNKTIKVNVIGTAPLRNGDKYTVLQATGGETKLNATGVNLTDDYLFVDFTGEKDEGDYKVVVKANYDVEGFAQTKNTKSVGAIAQNWIMTPKQTGNIKEAAQVIAVSSSRDVLDENIGKITPSGYALNAETAFSNIQNMSNHVAGRMSGLRTGTETFLHQTASNSSMTNFASDPTTLALAIDTPNEIADWFNQKDYSVWGNIYGQYGKNDTTANALGFQSYNASIILGADAKVKDNIILGVLGSFGQTKVDYDKDRGETDITSFRTGVYASAYLTPSLYIDSIASFGLNTNDSERNIEIGNVDTVAKADYNSYDASLYTGVGYDMKLGSFSFVPNAWIQYSMHNQESVKESGAGNLNTELDKHIAHSFTTQIGAKFTRFMEIDGRPFVPEISFGWSHQWLDAQDLEGNFVGDSTNFTYNPGTPNKDSFLFGAGLSTLLNERTSFYSKYDVNLSKDAQVHGLTLGLKFKF